MDADLNHVTFTGTLERDPVTRFAEHGKQQVGFTLRVSDPGPSGQAFSLFVPCEVYGLVAGKLKWTSWTDKSGQKRTTLAVLASLVQQAYAQMAMALQNTMCRRVSIVFSPCDMILQTDNH